MGGIVVKRALGLLLVGILALTFGSVVALAQTGNGHAEPPNTGGVFTDVARDHWAYEDLEYLQSRATSVKTPPVFGGSACPLPVWANATTLPKVNTRIPTRSSPSARFTRIPPIARN